MTNADPTPETAEPAPPISSTGRPLVDRTARWIGRRILGTGPAGLILLALLAAAILVPGLFHIPPVDRDEARFAQATVQMLESGDYIDIRFQDDPRHKKPVGIYWLQALSAELVGPVDTGEIWPYRLPSLLGIIIAVVTTAWLGARLFGRETGLAAGLFLCLTIIVGVEARLAKTDAMLLATTVIAMAALARTYLSTPENPPWRITAVVFWTAIGVGLLLKGPIILLPVFGCAVLVSLLDLRAGWLLRLRPLWGIPLMLAIFLPWFIAIILETDGAFLDEAVGRDLLGKVGTGQESHGAPPGYHTGMLFIVAWPVWPLLFLAAPVVWREWKTPAVRFCVAWLVPTWIVFEAVATKLPHYVLPAYPALMLLFAAAATRDGWTLPPISRWLFWPIATLWGVLAIALPIGLGVAAFILAEVIDPIAWLMLALASVIFVSAIPVARSGSLPGAVLYTTIAALLFYGAAYQRVLPALEPIWISPRVAAAIDNAVQCPDPAVLVAGFNEPSLVFALGSRMTQADDAIGFLDEGGCRFAVVAERHRQGVVDGLAIRGRTPLEIAQIAGIRINGGNDVILTIFAPGESADATPQLLDLEAGSGVAPSIAPPLPSDTGAEVSPIEPTQDLPTEQTVPGPSSSTP